MTLRTTSGKSCPLATIWVPISTPGRRPVELAEDRGRVRRARPRCPSRAGIPAADRPAPRRALDPLGARAVARHRDRPALRTASRRRLGVAAVVAAKRPPARCRTSETSQFGHRHACPHSRQLRCGDHPRRGTITIAFPPSLARARASAARVRACSGPSRPSRSRMSRTSTGGRSAPSARSGELDPLESQPALGARRRRARDEHRPARRAPGGSPRRGRRSGGRTPACTTSRAPRRRRSGRVRPPGANTADRGPTQIRASPRRRRCHSSRRSPWLSAEWRIATRSPKRDSNRETVCGVRPISGTRTIAPRPRSSAASVAAR